MKAINRRHALSGLAASALCLMANQVLSQAKPATNAPQKLSDVVLFELINKGGRLRMLSQRMAKAYAQMGLGILRAVRSKYSTVQLHCLNHMFKLYSKQPLLKR